MGMKWYVFSMQRRPVKKIKEIIKEIIWVMHENGRKFGDGKKNLKAPFTHTHQDTDQLTSRGEGCERKQL
jgi:hypothetical protein